MKYLNLRPLVAILLCCVFASCKEQSPKETSALNFRGVDSLLNASVEQHHIPGAVAFVSHKGEPVFSKAFGYKNVQNATEMSTKTLFRLASMTKALTAVSILQLAEKQQLDLQDPVKKYLPEFANPEILVEVHSDSSFTSQPAENDITIHQLLTHTSGIGYGFQNEEYNKIVLKNEVSEGFCEDARTSLENTNKIAALPLLAEPGTTYIYSLSYDVLGTLIEVVSGQRYDGYVQEHILTLLGMSESYFTVPENEQYRLASVYQPTEDNENIVFTTYEDIEYPTLTHRQFFSGGADLVATAEDYNKFLMMLVNQGSNGTEQLLQPSSVRLMLSPQTPLGEDESVQGFAAWMVNDKGAKNGLRPKGSYDFGGFFDTYCWVDPDRDFTAVLLLQMYPTNAHDVHWEFQKSVYKSFEPLNTTL